MIAAFDLETDLVQPGLNAPPVVCGSMATSEADARVLSLEETRSVFQQLLDSNCHVTGAYVAFDMIEMMVDNPALTTAVFRKYERGEVEDVQIDEALYAIERGHLGLDPRTGGDLRDPETGQVKKRYSLAIVADLNGLSIKKGDTYRLKYASLRGIPLSQWPEAAREYPRQDVIIPLAIRARQQERGGRNIANQPLRTQVVRTSFCLALAGTWGVRINAFRLNKVKARVAREWAAGVARWQAKGFLDAEGKEDGTAVRRAVAMAYGATGAPCATCAGTGKVLSPKTNKPVQCRECSATGIEAGAMVPRTDPSTLNPRGQISKDRDTLDQSGDDDLEEYGEVSNLAKLRDTYIPALEQGTRVPITLQANPLLATQRVSYDGVVQLLPRKGGIRECHEAREGYVYCSCDYSMLELVTLSQTMINLRLSRKMADAINSGKDLHTMLAAQMTGQRYEALLELVKAKDKKADNYRQAAKEGNFGFPGGMGAPKVVFTARKKGIRFCVLTGRAPKCNQTIVREWGSDLTTGKPRKIVPTCRECILAAEEIRENWFELWQVRPYFEVISREQKAKIPVVSFGTGLVRGGTQFNDRANHRFQNLAGQLATHAMWLVSKECYTDRHSPLWGSRPWGFIHDEILSELVESRATEAAYRKADLMMEAGRVYCPDVKTAVEPAIARFWYKAMATVKDTQGKLVPWEPKCKGCNANGWERLCGPECLKQEFRE